MTKDAYKALTDCAFRRIEREWECNESERAVLHLVNELSFALEQTWAAIAKLSDFGEALGYHKSSISRAIRSASRKGYLAVTKFRDETLYTVCIQTKGQSVAEDDTRAAAKKRLIEQQMRRLKGTGDLDGQIRLPGILPNEEVEVPSKAFEAMLEEIAMETAAPPAAATTTTTTTTTTTPAGESVPRGTESLVRPRSVEAVEEEDLSVKLERLARTQAAIRGEDLSVPANFDQPAARPATSSEKVRLDAQMAQFCRGLTGEPLYAMQRVREEVQAGGKLEEAAFFKYGTLWRQRAETWAHQLLEAAAAHKEMRLRGQRANSPGAWIFATWKQIVAQTTAGGV